MSPSEAQIVLILDVDGVSRVLEVRQPVERLEGGIERAPVVENAEAVERLLSVVRFVRGNASEASTTFTVEVLDIRGSLGEGAVAGVTTDSSTAAEAVAGLETGKSASTSVTTGRREALVEVQTTTGTTIVVRTTVADNQVETVAGQAVTGESSEAQIVLILDVDGVSRVLEVRQPVERLEGGIERAPVVENAEAVERLLSVVRFVRGNASEASTTFTVEVLDIRGSLGEGAVAGVTTDSSTAAEAVAGLETGKSASTSVTTGRREALVEVQTTTGTTIVVRTTVADNQVETVAGQAVTGESSEAQIVLILDVDGVSRVLEVRQPVERLEGGIERAPVVENAEAVERLLSVVRFVRGNASEASTTFTVEVLDIRGSLGEGAVAGVTTDSSTAAEAVAGLETGKAASTSVTTGRREALVEVQTTTGTTIVVRTTVADNQVETVAGQAVTGESSEAQIVLILDVDGVSRVLEVRLLVVRSRDELKNEAVDAASIVGSVTTNGREEGQDVEGITVGQIREVQAGSISERLTNIVVAVASDLAPLMESRSSSGRASDARPTIYEEVEQSDSYEVQDLRNVASEDPEEFTRTDRIENVGSTLVSRLLTRVKALAASIVSFGKTTSGERITSSAARNLSADSDVPEAAGSVRVDSGMTSDTERVSSDVPAEDERSGKSKSEAVSVSTASSYIRLIVATVTSAAIVSFTPALAGVTSIAVALALAALMVTFGLIRGPTAQLTAKYNNNNPNRGLFGLRALRARISGQVSVIAGGASWLLSILNQTSRSLISSKYRRASASSPAAVKQQQTRSDYISSQTLWSMSTVRTALTTLGTGLLASVSTLFEGLFSKLWSGATFLSTPLRVSIPTSIKTAIATVMAIVVMPSAAFAQDAAVTATQSAGWAATLTQIASYALMAAAALFALMLVIGMISFMIDTFKVGMIKAMRKRTKPILTVVLAATILQIFGGVMAQSRESDYLPPLPRYEQSIGVQPLVNNPLLPPMNWTSGDPLVRGQSNADVAEVTDPVRVAHAGEDTPAADRWTYETNGLRFYTMRDLARKTGNR